MSYSKTKNLLTISFMVIFVILIIGIVYVNQRIMVEIEEADNVAPEVVTAFQPIVRRATKVKIEPELLDYHKADEAIAGESQKSVKKKRQRVIYELPLDDDVLLQ